jgi:drug/metabolite transporter (DMT)-like permease
MTAGPSGDAALRRRAILFVLGSSFAFTVAAALVKVVAPEVPTIEIMLFRSLVAFLFMLPLLRRQGGWSALATRRPVSHLLRALAGLAGMFGSFYGLAHLPIAAVTALGFAMPIFLAVLSVPMLGERVTLPRAVSIAAGLLGVLLVVRPWEGKAGLPLFETAVVVLGVAAWALAMASIRRMGQAGERNITIVVLFSLACTLMTAVASVPIWVTPRPEALAVLVGVGLVSGVAQLMMTEGYRSGEASMLAPFEYSAIFYTVLMGWMFWGEVPGAWETAGILVLVASGLFTWWREGRSRA